MDIESFNQCLAYVQATASTDSSLGAWLGIAGTLGGTGFGWWLNHRTTSKKEERTALLKKDCCLGEIKSLLGDCDHSSHQVQLLIKELGVKQRPKAHRLPSNVKLMLLENIYPEVASLFSQQQQDWIRWIFRTVDNINKGLAAVADMRSEKSLFSLSKVLVNLQADLYDASRLGLYVINDEKIELPALESMLTQIGVAPPCLLAHRALILNIQRNDELLGLDKEI
ncbi:hypothetical protein [Pseudomonas sp. LS.1a]|uniref:hypothetical protein n=1 Tax=Pseudomonas sp. LS.1a TaxID=2920387 RepID=UPI001F13769F|nr:hypothetical protein [Pseudomonas sp. LS.1a]UMY62028.1 hypothetical protein MKK04_01805 [Pseudomonas sp. LS.1a]